MEEISFDENVTNIDDLYGEQMIKLGYNLIYEPEACVFHHHGLHHGNNRKGKRGNFCD